MTKRKKLWLLVALNSAIDNERSLIEAHTPRFKDCADLRKVRRRCVMWILRYRALAEEIRKAL